MQHLQAVDGNFVGSGLGALDLVRYTAGMREAPEAALAGDNCFAGQSNPNQLGSCSVLCCCMSTNSALPQPKIKETPCLRLLLASIFLRLTVKGA